MHARPKRLESVHVLSLGAICGCLVVMWVALTACSCTPATMRHRHDVHGASHRSGPPPHAPAHGYRHKHRKDGVELVFDSGRGVYLVVGLPACYFLDGIYYRQVSRQWEMTSSIEGNWSAVGQEEIPAGLRSGHSDASASSVHPGNGKEPGGKSPKHD